MNVELEEIEERLTGMKGDEFFEAIATEYNRMLQILGNVDGNEIVFLACIAMEKEMRKPRK